MFPPATIWILKQWHENVLILQNNVNTLIVQTVYNRATVLILDPKAADEIL